MTADWFDYGVYDSATLSTVCGRIAWNVHRIPGSGPGSKDVEEDRM